jgi:hypothetical protein
MVTLRIWKVLALMFLALTVGSEAQSQVVSDSLPSTLPHRASPLALRTWILKFNPCLIVRGEVPIYLERKLSSDFSMEGAVGTTFQDYFKKVFLEGKDYSQKDPNTEYLSGIAAKLSLRYFPKHVVLSDVYISAEVDFTNYRKNVSGAFLSSTGGYQEGKLMDQQKYFDYLVILGSQNSKEVDQEIFLDWFLGAGVRTGIENNVMRIENNSQILVQKQASVLSPILTLGLKIGLGF